MIINLLRGSNTSGVINIKSYGARVDGVTDDTEAIRAAIAASTEGALIYYPPGTAIVSGILAPKSGTTNIGVRGKSIIKIKDGVVGFNVFQPAGSNNIVFEDLIIDLNKANTTNPGSGTVGLGIYAAPTGGGIGFVYRRVEVRNGWQIGLRFLGDTGETNPANLLASEITIEDCYVHDCDGQGIMAVNTTRLRIKDCHAINNGRDGIFHSFSRDTIIENNTCVSNGEHGIVITYAESMKAAKNTCRGNTFWGIAVGGGSVTLNPNKNYVLSGNVCSANGFGGITNDPTVTGFPGTPVDASASIADNICFNNLTNHGIYVHNAKNISIDGNVCFGNPNTGIAVHGVYASISNNVCFGNTAYGINLQADGTETTPYGHHKLGSNTCYGNGTSDFHADAAVVDYTITGPGPDVQEYAANGTWTKPFAAKRTRSILIGPGGSTGSGRKGLIGSLATGATGGAGGGVTDVEFESTDLTATVPVTIGAAGAVGAAQTTNSTDGNAASSGTNTTFGSYAMAMAGGRGLAGSTAAVTGPTGGGGTSGGQPGGSSSATTSAGPATNNNGGGGGGGSGGTITAANAAQNGAAGSTPQSVATGRAGAGGIVDTTAPTSGTASTTKGAPSPGAGGGAASTTTNAQDGAAGSGYGSGAGGGGAARDGVGNSGAGALGGPGYAIIITRY